MRPLLLLLSLLTAMPVSATTCITVKHQGLWFFAESESVFIARAESSFDGVWVLRVEQVLRGTVRLGEGISFRPGLCEIVRDGERYLVASRETCATDERCFNFADETQTEGLLHYLANAHPETHETVMAAFLRWYRDEMSLRDFAEWIDTASVRRRAALDDEFAYGLIEELRDTFSELRPFARHADDESFAREALREVARLMEQFPPGLAEEFDARMAQASADDAPARDDLEELLRNALSAARESEAWQKMRARVVDAQDEAGPDRSK